jgi:hypothetical protein
VRVARPDHVDRIAVFNNFISSYSEVIEISKFSKERAVNILLTQTMMKPLIRMYGQIKNLR